MKTKDIEMLIGLAEKEISEILKNLEINTGTVLNSICVKDVNMTSIEDERPQLIRRVLIEVLRQPGTKWSQ